MCLKINNDELFCNAFPFENSYDFISGYTIRRGVYYCVARVTCLVSGKAVSVQMSQIRMSQVEEEQKGHKRKAPPLSNGGSVTNVSNIIRTDPDLGVRKGTEIRRVLKRRKNLSVPSLMCKICQCVFCDEDDKFECGRCEKWECLNC